MIRVAIVNHPGSGADDKALPKIAKALQTQVTKHFAPFYNLTCTVVVTKKPKPTDWVIGLFKDADQPDALGYHDVTPSGLPLAKVFPILDAADGANLSTTISHELLEMLADPYLCTACQASDGKFWAYESCDAVEADEYKIGTVTVSNFVTPQYYSPPSDLTGVKLDYLGLIKSPYEIRPGGYGQWNKGAGWQQVVHASVPPRRYRQLGMATGATGFKLPRTGRFARRRAKLMPAVTWGSGFTPTTSR